MRSLSTPVASTSGRGLAPSEGSLRAVALTSVSRRRTGASRRSAVVVRAAFDVGGSSVDAVTSLTSAVTSLALAGAGWYLLNQQLQLEQDRTQSNRQECPSCNGTGYEPCACRRWNDGDVGCSSCNKTGYMTCRSCGGGGTAVPIPLAIRKHDPPRQQ